MLHILKKTVKTVFSIVLVLVLLFEEWGWEPLSRIWARLARLPLWARMERGIARLRPAWALGLLLLPMVVLFPVKLLALAMLAKGYVGGSISLIVTVKLLGTGLVARLFDLTRPALMQLGWFARWYPRWTDWKAAWFARIRMSRPWRVGRAMKRQAVRWWQRRRADWVA